MKVLMPFSPRCSVLCCGTCEVAVRLPGDLAPCTKSFTLMGCMPWHVVDTRFVVITTVNNKSNSGGVAGAALHGVERPCDHALTLSSVLFQKIIESTTEWWSRLRVSLCRRPPRKIAEAVHVVPHEHSQTRFAEQSVGIPAPLFTEPVVQDRNRDRIMQQAGHPHATDHRGIRGVDSGTASGPQP